MIKLKLTASFVYECDPTNYDEDDVNNGRPITAKQLASIEMQSLNEADITFDELVGTYDPEVTYKVEVVED